MGAIVSARERRTSPPLPHECDAAGPRQRRRGRGLAVTVLTLVAAGALVAFTAVSTSHIIGRGSHYRTASPLTVGSRAVASATCAAWPSAKLDIDTVSALPAGWYWDTTFSRSNLRDHAAAVSRALDVFDSQVAATDPARVVTAAHAYVTAKRAELSALTARTFDDTVASAVTVARSGLNRACGLPDKGLGSI
ncbi:hypothetical protein BH09ACT7_BH09ACT7_61400 [soil metagenome]